MSPKQRYIFLSKQRLHETSLHVLTALKRLGIKRKNSEAVKSVTIGFAFLASTIYRPPASDRDTVSEKW